MKRRRKRKGEGGRRGTRRRRRRRRITVFDVRYSDGTLSDIGCQNHLHVHNELSLTVHFGTQLE